MAFNSKLNDYSCDIFFIAILSLTAFAYAYHPYYFGDELVAIREAVRFNFKFSPAFDMLNTYKPRLVFNGIDAMLATIEASRLTHVIIVSACMVWINVIIYNIARSILKIERFVALLLILIVLTSRYGVMVYFDYIAGLIELLSLALFLSMAAITRIAIKKNLKMTYIAGAIGLGILCIFTHERYVAGLFAIGGIIVFLELKKGSDSLRYNYLAFGISVFFIPLLSYILANYYFNSSSLMLGTAGQIVTISLNTLLTFFTYCLNVFLNWNFGSDWFWGSLNSQREYGRVVGGISVLVTIAFALIIVKYRMYDRSKFSIAAGFLLTSLAFIAVASLPGSGRQEARFMLPVGVLVSLMWIVMLKERARYYLALMLLGFNCTYLFSGSYNYIYNVTGSRGARSLAQSIYNMEPMGKHGLIVGNKDGGWIYGGSVISAVGPRLGAVFSKVNLSGGQTVDPFSSEYHRDSTNYDFGLIFVGYDSARSARYRLTSAEEALIATGTLSVDSLATKRVLGDEKSWVHWNWKVKPLQFEGVLKIEPGVEGWFPVSATELAGRWLVYTARTAESGKVPMRLQVNWHSKDGNRFISTSISVVYPSSVWKTYATHLSPPDGADIGEVYATLHDNTKGIVDVKSIELR